MGQCFSTVDNTNVSIKVDIEAADRLLEAIERTAEGQGLEGVEKDFDLAEEYKKGYLRGTDMDYFILSLYNQCDATDKPIVIPKSTKARDVDGHIKSKLIEGLTNKLLKRTVLIPLIALKFLRDPSDAMQDLVNILRKANGHPIVKEGDGKSMNYIKQEFENWGKNVETNSILTFVPRTKAGLCSLVKWAKFTKKSIRASGFRHSWSSITVDDDQILVSLLPLKQVQTLPSFELPYDDTNDLQGIELLDKYVTENGEKKRLCKIGSGTTNEQFREFVMDKWEKDPTNSKNEWWTLPLNVIMVEITCGGSNGPVCHGSGKSTTTLSDLVAAIEFVNANGELQVVDDPLQLKSVSGCFGMLGIVTSITMKLDALTFARMIPKKKRLALTIPPPLGFEVPDGVDMSGITQKMLDQAFDEFVETCENDYYVEYFWFPSQKNCWLNNWKNDGKPSDCVTEYPLPEVIKYQEFTSFLSGVANSTIFRVLPGSFQLKVMSTFAMLDLPKRNDDDPIVTPLIEALHFRRGIQNMRVSDMEWEIPIPMKKSDPSKPDYSICQKAWWGVIKLFYDRFNKDKNDCPMRLPVEMRITGGSSVNIAPQFGNNLTCSIEILSPQNVDRKEWLGFMQETTELWTNLKYDNEEPIHPFKNDAGKLLYPRPHWAKEWEGLIVKGQPIKEYLREVAYKDQIHLFRGGLDAAAKAGGYTFEDAEKMFSTKFSREMFGSHA